MQDVKYGFGESRRHSSETRAVIDIALKAASHSLGGVNLPPSASISGSINLRRSAMKALDLVVFTTGPLHS